MLKGLKFLEKQGGIAASSRKVLTKFHQVLVVKVTCIILPNLYIVTIGKCSTKLWEEKLSCFSKDK